MIAIGISALFFFVHMAIVGIIQADLFTSTSAMERMFNQEIDVVGEVDRFIESQAHKHQIFKRLAQEYQSKIQEFLQTVDRRHAENPVAAYLILKRLAALSAETEAAIRTKQLSEDIITQFRQMISNIGLSIPDQTDIDGAGVGLIRLQDTYNFSTQQMADGTFPGVPFFGPLSGKDCHDLGALAGTRDDDYHMILWLEEARDRLKVENPQSIQEPEFLGDLAEAYYRQNMTPRAIVLMERLLELEPKNTKAIEKLISYQSTIEEIRLKGTDDQKKRLAEVADGTLRSPMQLTRVISKSLNLHHQALCRGENTAKPHGLLCYYKTNKPSLRLAPIKTEVANWHPRVLLFRDVITPREASHIKEIAARNEIKRTRVVAAISRRVGDMIDLDVKRAEVAQIANYGIGGHYEVHHDNGLYYRNLDEQDMVNAQRYNRTRSIDDRIATTMFYLVQPIAGGATIFLEIDLSIAPTAGDAVFWYNVKKNGHADPLVRHMACPVLTGSKWVLNKWISERNQEFLYPCSLNMEE